MNKQPVKRGFPAREQFVKSLLSMSHLTHLELRAAVALGMHLNCMHGRCDPGYPLLAKELGVMIRSARRAVAGLVAHGIVEVDGSAGGSHKQTANFRLFMLPERVTSSMSPVEALDDVSERVTCTVSPVTGDGRVTKPNLTGDETAHGRVTPRRPHNSEKGNSEKDNKAATPQAALVTPVEVTEDDYERAYAALCDVYPNKTNADHREAFDKLLDEGIEPYDLVSAAKLYAVKHAGMKPKDFPLLCYWLRVDAKDSLADSSLNEGRGGFANAGLVIDEAGNVIDEVDEIETSSPDARAPQSYFEAAYGDTQ
jgi:hypothetical protein